MTTADTASRTSTRRSPGRTSVLIGLGILVALVVISVLSRDDATFPDPLDPRNPGHDGGQAVARVLAAHGVDVRIARGEDDLLGEEVDAGTTVVVTNPDELGSSTLRTLRDRAKQAGAIVVVGNHALLGDRFGIEDDSYLDGRRPARCDEPLAHGLVVRTHDGGGLKAAGCFGSEGTSVLVRRDALWLMTDPSSFTNEHLLESDNGALALRLLGQQDRLVWYVADSADTAASDGVSLSGLLPTWLVPGLYLLLASLLGVVLWRGRRLGPLVTEPLPVVVRAAESTQSRGRIYRSTGDRRHAAAILVDAARRRLTEALQLPRGTPVETLAAAAAARTGRDPRAVLALLGHPSVTKDSQMVELGQQLIELENEVRTP
jgi:hypothetical protein